MGRGKRSARRIARSERRVSPLNAGLILAVVILAALFVLESDDCYFVYWQYDSLADFLLTRPVTDEARIVGVPQNGRYLGNLLGVLLAKSYETPLWFVRVVYFAGGLLLLARAGACCVCPDRRREGTFLLLAVLILSFRGIWQEVYSWGAAYVNYVTPMVLILLLPPLLRGDGNWSPGARRALLAGLSFAACLFLETTTIFLCLSALIALGFSWLTGRPGRGEALALAVGSVLGTAVMFTAPGYGAVGSDGLRELGLSLIGDSLTQTLVGTVVRPAPAALMISCLLLRFLRRQGGTAWRWCGLAALPLHGICLWSWGRDLADPGLTVELPPADGLLVGTGAALAVLWVVMLALWKGRGRGRTAALAAALCLISGPLLVLSVRGNRYFFPGYVILALVLLSLYDCAREEGMGPAVWTRVLALTAAVALIGVYFGNCAVFRQRLDYGRELAEQGAVQMTLPLLPFAGFARNEQLWKGDLSYLIYRETPWDVAFTFVPFGQWPGWEET